MYKQNPWTNHEIDKMLSLLRSGKTVIQVAKILGRSVSSITGQRSQVVYNTVISWNALKDLCRLPM